MESFRHTTNAGNYAVHTGFWTDWTNGPVFGATITLNKRDGSLLIAFVALFVSLVGTSFWRICCFALHQFYSTNVAQDALYHQRQAIFRNAANGTSGLWGLLTIWWEWRKTAVDRPSQRLLPAVGFALCCIGAFATASTFSSKISTATEGVLVRSPNCGILDSVNNPNIEDLLSYYYSWSAQMVSSWAIYAQDCYLNVSDLGSCNAFVQPQLPVKIDRNASCPFQDGICKSEYGNILFDTLLDSHFDLGLNAPPHERILFRRLSSCAPIKTDGYQSMYYSPETAMNYSRYYYGPPPITTRNFTYEYPQVSWDSKPSTPGLTLGNGGDRYSVKTRTAFHYNGSYAKLSLYDPIPPLRQQDADVHLIFLSANSIVYTQQVSDPWYSATTNGTEISSKLASGRATTYKADQPISVLACSIKEQYCNPNLPTGEQCSPFGGVHESYTLAEGIWKASKQRTAFGWIGHIIYGFGVGVNVIPSMLREGALLATYKAQVGVSSGLPDNQWQLEVENWHAATLVALQGSMTQVAKGTSDENLKPFLTTPNNTDEQNLCNNQKIPSADHSNFSVFGLSFTLALGSIIICLSYTLETLTNFIQKKRRSAGSGAPSYARLEWITDETLQLQRQAYEQSGIGVWEGCASSVPVTKGGERLAVLDLENLDCPRLRVVPLHGVVVDAGQFDHQADEVDEGEMGEGDGDSTLDGSVRVDEGNQGGDDGGESPEGSAMDAPSLQGAQSRHSG